MLGLSPPQDTSALSRDGEPMDSLAPSEQMRAVDEAMRRYFRTFDWVRARNKAFPGLANRSWVKPQKFDFPESS